MLRMLKVKGRSLILPPQFEHKYLGIVVSDRTHIARPFGGIKCYLLSKKIQEITTRYKNIHRGGYSSNDRWSDNGFKKPGFQYQVELAYFSSVIQKFALF